MHPEIISWEKARDARRDLLDKLSHPYWLVGISIDPRGPHGYFLEVFVFHDSAKIPYEHMGVPILRRKISTKNPSRSPNTWSGADPLVWEDCSYECARTRRTIRCFRGPWGSLISDCNFQRQYNLTSHSLGISGVPIFIGESAQWPDLPTELLFAAADNILRENVRSRAKMFCGRDPWERIAELEAEVAHLRDGGSP